MVCVSDDDRPRDLITMREQARVELFEAIGRVLVLLLALTLAIEVLIVLTLLSA